MIHQCKGLFVFFLLLIFNNVFSQNFSGRIIDKNSNPIAGSAVLIKEVNQGLACTDEGEFQITLPIGVYSVEYRCMGYENHTEKIVIQSGLKLNKNIVLNENPITLQEVVISNGEDPAYAIMRKTIAKAPYYQTFVREYDAECYIKGNMELVKVNKLVDKMTSVNGIKMSDYQGNLFVQESYSNIKFKAPDQYEQTITAFSRSMPDDMDPKEAMRLISYSLYLPHFSGLVSPLNPQALKYYSFRYEGYSEEDGDIINKIKITPKLKDPELVQGYIYIADDSWDIRYADLLGKMFGIEQNFKITYSKINDTVYMPTTFANYLKGGIVGIEGSFNYYASVKYNSLVINDSIQEGKKEKKKKSLEIKRNANYQVHADSLATKRDSLYWLDIRNAPLSVKEVKSYEVRDSLQQRIDSVRKTYTNAKFKPSHLFKGGRIGGDSTKIAFKYGGILGALRDYNFVDGFGLGQRLEISTKVNEKNKLLFSPEVYYTTARRQITWKTDLEFSYASMRQGLLSVSIGDVSADFNPQGVPLLDNAVNTLVWGRNRRMLYRQKYAQITNNIDLTNGLALLSQMKIAERSALENNTYYSFLGTKRKSRENIQSLHHTDLLSYSIGLSYTPEYYYYVHNGKKQYAHSVYPTFTVLYTEGFSSIKYDNAKYRRLEGNILQEMKTDLFSKIRYEINGGAYLGAKDQMNLADYKHFNTTDDVWFVTKTPYKSFMLLDAYEASTNDYWFSAHINYLSKYILLKRLPFLQGKLFNEAIHLKYLYTPAKKNYTEAGYSVDLFNEMSFGVYCSFDRFNYENFGVKLSFNLNVIK